ncbi:MAG: DeoR/GlpR family DNA-binding transcription regulator, partial [Absicoccus porci]|uniref:DeoR/GlpR family DNA-binding transcription regulator n=1 Tax=Absicoccus porci TaxID=2486576 RepID=UPI00240A3945
MLAQQRQEAIVEEVNEKGSVLVKELAIKYNVTQDSIRKDLNILQKQGLLKKTYGGAVRIRKKIAVQDLVASKRISKNRAAKQAIAQRAYHLIEPNDLIFLDLSTSNLELARLLMENDKGATIVTNMLDIA